MTHDIFDADAFMSQNLDTPLETELKLCPEGDHQAMIDDFTSDAFERHDFTYRQGPRAGEPGSMQKFNCPFVIQDAQIASDLGRTRIIVPAQIILDMNPDGSLATGVNKNLFLGQIRDALNQNKPGPWSFGLLRGAGPLMVRVHHESGRRKDGSEFKMARVIRVAPIR